MPQTKYDNSTFIKSNELIPLFLQSTTVNLAIVGGGSLGLKQLKLLLDLAPSASIKIISTNFHAEIISLAKGSSNIKLVEKAFELDDLQNQHLLFIAIKNSNENSRILNFAKHKNILTHVVNNSYLSDFDLKKLKNDELFNSKISLKSHPQNVDSTKSNFKEVNWKRVATYSVAAFAFMLIGHFVFSYLPLGEMKNKSIHWLGMLDASFPWIVLAGFLAQLVDGALGMGYGVTSATILLSSGVPLPAISSSIHTAEMFSSAASGYSHYKFGNVNKKLFWALVVPGVLGAIAGAVLLSLYGDSHASWLKPMMAVYTMFLGIKIIITAFRKQLKKKNVKNHWLLAGSGGFLDSFGGGGWGPIVTTTLISRGRNPKYVIGSVSLTEFFVTLASALTFFTLMGVSHWQVILALVIGGLIAAPIAAKLVGKLPRRTTLLLLGALVIIWSLKILVNVFN